MVFLFVDVEVWNPEVLIFEPWILNMKIDMLFKCIWYLNFDLFLLSFMVHVVDYRLQDAATVHFIFPALVHLNKSFIMVFLVLLIEESWKLREDVFELVSIMDGCNVFARVRVM